MQYDYKEGVLKYTSKWEKKTFIQPLWEPTPLVTVRNMLELARVRAGDTVYDLGCGDARILITAVKEYGAGKAVGYEVNAYLCQQAEEDIRRENLQNRITVFQEDLIQADLSQASVITLFLSRAANECIAPKLEKETRPLTRIVSYYHPMQTWQVKKSEGPLEDRLYLYVAPEAFKFRREVQKS